MSSLQANTVKYNPQRNNHRASAKGKRLQHSVILIELNVIYVMIKRN